MSSILVILCWNIFSSCKAESVGVFIPPKGIKSVSYHDLERDMKQLFTGKENWVSKRMVQMGWTEVLETSFSGRCFTSSSNDTQPLEERSRYTFYSNTSDWSHVVHLASMLSLAKGLSSCEVPIILCENDDMVKQFAMTNFFTEQHVQKLEDIDVRQLENTIKKFIISEVDCQPEGVP